MLRGRNLGALGTHGGQPGPVQDGGAECVQLAGMAGAGSVGRGGRGPGSALISGREAGTT